MDYIDADGQVVVLDDLRHHVKVLGRKVTLEVNPQYFGVSEPPWQGGSAQYICFYIHRWVLLELEPKALKFDHSPN